MLLKYRLPTKNGLLDWDCAEAIDVPGMADSLSYIREQAAFPVCVPLPSSHLRLHTNS